MMYNRGNAFLMLPLPDPDANVREAIRSYELTLQVCTRASNPDLWGKTMHNKGAAVLQLRHASKADLTAAIQSLDMALTLRSPDANVHAWAMTTIDKIMVLMKIPEERVSNLTDAIRLCELVLHTAPRDRYENEWTAANRLRDEARTLLAKYRLPPKIT